MIIEWNNHIFSADTQRYPFHPQAVYRPATDRLSADPLTDYKAHMRAEGIDRAVLVHPEPYGDDHRLVLDCLKREPDLFKGTCLFYPKDKDAPQKLKDLVQAHPNLVALRFHAHRGKESYLDSFADAGVRAQWEMGLELGLIVELHIGPNYAAQVAQVLAAYPQTVALIDHLAEPHMGDAVEFAQVLELAAFDHVYMKLSGLSHFAQDGPLYESARPFTRRVIEAFGPDRLVWGSGTPAIVDAHMETYGQADRAKVKGGNLARLLNWS
ncbi:MAG: amidohydrolase family protein [Candidatus Latescibacteria bacterium]|nr:amidohydrolase family protein [Candidatus Latescibacterota bacterium]